VLELTVPSIIAAHDLLPSEAEKLDPANVLGVCLESGSASAHSVILVRAHGIPCVVGLGPALAAVHDGTLVAIDSERGTLRVSPPAEDMSRIEERRGEWMRARDRARADRKQPAITRDGRRIRVLSNLSRDTEVFDALENGAEGVGVLRTEFLFLNRKTPPTELEQYDAYRSIADALEGRPLVIRTLDVGGDKSAPYIDTGGEANPFLGWRGVRISLDRRDLFETQLRAILRAAHERPVEVLLPMISTVTELRSAKKSIAAVEDQLRQEGVAFGAAVPVGVMIEVPAAAATASELAVNAARLSIGTNDLVQYMMAADRTNSRVAPLADHFQPAILRTIRDVAEAGRRAGIRVDVCGEMGADPLAIPLLIGLGIEEVSVSSPLIPDVKRAVGSLTVAECEVLAAQSLAAESNEEVQQFAKTCSQI
jgi:phosphocarrier protein FPr